MGVRQILSFVIVLLSTLLPFHKSEASHSMGADITYICNGNGQYAVTLKFFRDCDGIDPGNTATINYQSASCGVNNSINLTLQGSPIDITPLCPGQNSNCNGGVGIYGVQQYTYIGTITLPPSCGNDWVLSYGTCCRNNAITTLNGPANQDFYVQALLDNTITLCNNSPTFSNPPTAFICNGQNINYNHGVVDPDGDSLVFSLGACLQGNGMPVNYAPGFSGTAPLSATGLTINPVNGSLNFTPTGNQVGVLCIKVEEFRNGVKIGEVVRDMQFYVLTCTNNLPVISGIDSTNSFLENIISCGFNTSCFNVYGFDLDVLNNLSLNWNQGVSGATFTVSNQNAINPIGTFCWTPQPSDVGTHFFTVTITDDACPIIGSNTFTYQVNVTLASNPPVNAGPNVTICDGDSTQLIATLPMGGSPVGYQWTPNIGLSNAKSISPFAKPTQTTTYQVEAIYADSCNEVDIVTVFISPKPQISIFPQTQNVCPGASAIINGNAVDTGLTFTWIEDPAGANINLGSGTVSGTNTTISVSPLTNTTYLLYATNSYGCLSIVDTAYVTINAVNQIPQCVNIYVSPVGNSSNPGTRAFPTDLLTALNMVQCSNAHIKIAVGTYNINQAITNISSNVTLEGGYNSTFTQKMSYGGGQTRINRTSFSPTDGPTGTNTMAAIVITNAQNFTFQDLTITTSNAQSPPSDTTGVSILGLVLDNCSNYNIIRTEITTGQASSGKNGTNGTNGTVGGNGSNASGQNAGAGGAPNGGNGGNGGNGCTGICSPGPGQNGQAGGGAIPGFGGMGNGGGGFFCPGGQGQSGGNGGNGANGTNGTSTNTIIQAGPWFGGSRAQNGTDGIDGSGGGGQGGEGGANGGFDGGGGGGGAGGGTAGSAGTGGFPGGSAISVSLINNGLNGNFIDCWIQPGSAGFGGNGGIGGNGANGGQGGEGDDGAFLCANDNRFGGDGGNGGNGGDGANAFNGTSSNMQLYSGSPLLTSITNFNLSLQPAITVDNISCTDTDIDFSASSFFAWNLGLGSNPSSPAGTNVTTLYNTVGWKDIVFGANIYHSFWNIAIAQTQKPVVATTANPYGLDTFILCQNDVANFNGNMPGDEYEWGFSNAIIPSLYQSDTAQILNGLLFATVGTFQITHRVFTDCCGWTEPDTIWLIVDSLPNLNFTGNQSYCINDTTTITLAGAHSYSWQPNIGISSDTARVVQIYGTNDITYFITGYSKNGQCIDTISIAINVIDELHFSSLVTDASCGNNGSIGLGITNGSGNYNYVWNTAQTLTGATDTLKNLAPGSYSVSVVDNVTGCVNDTSFLIGINPSSPFAFIDSSEIISCNGANDGSASGMALNGFGTAPFTYNWYDSLGTNISTSTSINNLSPGKYVFCVTDFLSCEGCDTIEIIEPDPVLIEILDTTKITCIDSSNGYLRVNASGGNGPYIINWSHDANNDSLSAANLSTGNYKIIATDVNGCADSVVINLQPTIYVNALFAISSDSVCTDSAVIITYLGGNNAGSNYSWNFDSGISTNLGGDMRGPYQISWALAGAKTISLTVDTGGCSADTSIIINVIARPTVVMPIGDTICTNSGIYTFTTATPNGTWTGNGIVGGSNLTGQFNPNLSGIGSHMVFYELKNSVGCSSIDSTLIIVNPLPLAPILPNDTFYCEYDTPATLFTQNSQVVIWALDRNFTNVIDTSSNLNPSKSITGLGTYKFYALKDSLGCYSPIDSVNITINAKPQPPIAPTSDTFCNNAIIPIYNIVGNNITWYSSNNLTAALYNGNSYNPPIAGTGVYTFFVTQTSNGCESEPDSFSIVVLPTISINILSNDTSVCDGIGLNNLLATGNGTGIQWYNSSAVISPIGNKGSFNPNPYASSPGTYVFYAQADSASCDSPLDSVSITINPNPQVSIFNIIDTVCFGDTLPILTTINNGGIINWYLNNSVVSIDTGSSINVNPYIITSGTYIFYAEETSDSSCVSLLDSTTIFVTPQLTNMILSNDTNYCLGDPILPISAAGNFDLNWYDNPSLATPIDTGQSFNPNPHISGVGTYVFYLQNNYNGLCDGPLDSITITVNTVAPAPTLTFTDTICFNDTFAILNANGSGGIITWFDDASLTNNISSGASFNPNSFTSGSGAFTFYAIEGFNPCISPADSITIVRLPQLSAIIQSKDTTYCTGNSFDTIMAISNYSPLKWYNNINLTGSPIFIGNNFDPTPFLIGVGSFTFYAIEDSLQCFSNIDSITIQLLQSPLHPNISASDTFCSGSSFPMLIATNPTGVVSWYNNSSLVNILDTGTSFNPNPYILGSGTFTFYAQNNNGGCLSPLDTAIITIAPALTSQIFSFDSTYCLGDSIFPLVGNATGNILKWRINSVASPVIFTGSLFNPAPYLTNAGNYTFYVNTDTLGCQTAFDSVTITIVSSGNAPQVSLPDTLCFGDPIPMLTATGNGGNLLWFADSLLINQIGTGGFIDVSSIVTSTGQYGFYVVEDSANCYSDIGSTSITQVGNLTSNIANNDTSYCFGANYQLLSFSSTVIGTAKWYNNLSSQPIQVGGSVFNPAPYLTGSGTFKFYVQQDTLGCFGNVDSIEIEILNTPPSPQLPPNDTLCFNDTLLALNAVGSGGNIIWYSDSNLTNQIATGSIFNPTPLVAGVGSYSFYVIEQNAICNSQPSSITIVRLPNLNVNIQSANTTYCLGDSIASLITTSSNNGTITWYNNSSLTNAVGFGNAININGLINTAGIYKFYAQESLNQCKGHVDSIELTINSVNGTISLPNDITICLGDSMPLLSANNAGTSQVYWYNNPTLNMPIDSGNSFNTNPYTTSVGSFMFFAQISENACKGIVDTIVVNVGLVPNAPNVSPNQIACVGDTLSFLTLGAIGIVQWYSDSLLTTLVNTGTTFSVTLPIAGNYSWYVTQSVGDCISPFSSVKAVIYNIPSAPTITGATLYCVGDTLQPILANGIAANYTWYDSTATTVIGSNSSLQLPPYVNAVGSYTFYASQTDSICESAKSPYTITILPIPSIPTAIVDTYCFGAFILPITAQGSGGSYYWYKGNPQLPGASVVNIGNNYSPVNNTQNDTIYLTELNVLNCESDPIQLVTRIIPPPVANAGLDTSVCEGNVVRVGGFPTTSVGASIQWTSNPIIGVSYLDSDTIANPTFIPPNSGAFNNYTFYIETDNGRCINRDTMVINVSSRPIVQILGLDTNNTFCASDDTMLLSGLPVGGTFALQNGLPIPNNILSPASFVTDSTYMIIYRHPGFAFNCGSSDTAFINIIAKPRAEIVAPTMICLGDTAIIQFTGDLSVVSYSWDFDKPSTKSGFNSGPYFVKWNKKGLKTIAVQVEGVNGCLADTFVTILVTGPSVETIENEKIEIGEEIKLFTSVVPIADTTLSYQWTSTGILPCSNCPHPLVAPLKDTWYYITITDKNGCTAKDSVLIEVLTDFSLFVPNLFSPNGDGLNDFAKVYAKGAENVTFAIYNRWGEKVFETFNIDEGWDGRFKDKDLNPAVFAYYVKVEYLNGQFIQQKGNITLLR